MEGNLAPSAHRHATPWSAWAEAPVAFAGAESDATAVRPSAEREGEAQTLDIEAGPLREVEQARRAPQYRGTKLGSAWPNSDVTRLACHIARRVGGHLTNRINHGTRKAADHTSHTS